MVKAVLEGIPVYWMTMEKILVSIHDTVKRKNDAFPLGRLENFI